MKGKKKAREVQPKEVVVWTIRAHSSLYLSDGFWWSKRRCEEHLHQLNCVSLRPIKVRIVPVLPKKRGARR